MTLSLSPPQLAHHRSRGQRRKGPGENARNRTGGKGPSLLLHVITTGAEADEVKMFDFRIAANRYDFNFVLIAHESSADDVVWLNLLHNWFPAALDASFCRASVVYCSGVEKGEKASSRFSLPVSMIGERADQLLIH